MIFIIIISSPVTWRSFRKTRTASTLIIIQSGRQRRFMMPRRIFVDR
ncbi:hypothetical protein MtrunA17_Chr4g0023751 [Medicago truncatula]|uniref:Uncharacterized protein n=1 Tax=Medicago truncatula TaxID=3880 RepID=A0A396I682_MEDTR|nr:hypothetical protein MtrunA17_Chr4g0023751 [Medicago truncatula]